jgi:acyl-coenzyme A synthetase/AMP-(fatty) acid ligase
VSRKDDFVKINGLLVSIVEIEQTLLQHPKISDCLVQVITNKQGLTKLKAQIITGQLTENDIPDIRYFLSDILESCKMPKYIEIVKELPIDIVSEISKTWNGKKIRRIEEDIE